MRPPNESEKEELICYLKTGSGYDDETARGLVSSASIGIVDDYITDCPGYAGKLMMVVWSGSPDCYQVFIWEREQLKEVEQDAGLKGGVAGCKIQRQER